MKVKVLYFAQVAEKTGVTTEELELNMGSTTEDLIELIESKYPETIQLKYKIAVDQVLLNGPSVLQENSEIALLPPFAGG